MIWKQIRLKMLHYAQKNPLSSVTLTNRLESSDGNQTKTEKKESSHVPQIDCIDTTLSIGLYVCTEPTVIDW